MYGGVVGKHEALRQHLLGTQKVQVFRFANVVEGTEEYYTRHLRKLAVQFLTWREQLSPAATLKSASMWVQLEAWWLRQGPLHFGSTDDRFRLRRELTQHLADLVTAPSPPAPPAEPSDA